MLCDRSSNVEDPSTNLWRTFTQGLEVKRIKIRLSRFFSTDTNVTIAGSEIPYDLGECMPVGKIRLPKTEELTKLNNCNAFLCLFYFIPLLNYYTST